MKKTSDLDANERRSCADCVVVFAALKQTDWKW